ncbi:hypothetical protein DPMN_097228 [Dreissena polymorpha]|uniref:Uncharacterized protein n=1 Tax=Dreissena polymorpha TaxID=45954 RepID=A0A9D4LAX1_DREPO|nr:hypothetical protein DPMN_097228 [Dreissena polymorpha]
MKTIWHSLGASCKCREDLSAVADRLGVSCRFPDCLAYFLAQYGSSMQMPRRSWQRHRLYRSPLQRPRSSGRLSYTVLEYPAGGSTALAKSLTVCESPAWSKKLYGTG